MDDPDLRSRVRGMLLAGACGDALGFPVEGASAAQIRALYPDGQRLEIGGVPAPIPVQVTDDTEMTLCLARSIVDHGAFDPEQALEHYLRWWEGNPAGIGTCTDRVLSDVHCGVSAESAARRFHEASGGQSAGNGAMMRLAPLVVLHMNDPERLAEAVAADTRLTHYDELAREASQTWAIMLAMELSGRHAPIGAMIGDQLNADSVELIAANRPGFCMSTLAIAAFIGSQELDVEDGIGFVIGLGGDTDTNAHIAGQLLGARLGEQAVPSRWVAQLEVAGEIRELADQLVDLRG